MQLSYFAIPSIAQKETQVDVISEVCSRYNVTLDDLKAQNREKNTVFVRHLLIYTLKQRLKLKEAQIAQLFGRDRKTVYHAIKSIDNYIFTNSDGKREEILQFIHSSRG